MRESSSRCNWSRRSFIKGAATLTAAGALAGCSPQTGNLAETGKDAATAGNQEIPETQIFSGACRGNCFGGCHLDVHVRDGQVVRTTAGSCPEPEYQRICPRGLTHVGRIYSSKRLQYPMRRVGERGEGEFERISWDEAISEICEKWKAITDEFGPGAMAVVTGSGCYGLTSGTGEMPAFGSFTNRFVNAVGASTVAMNLDCSAQPSSHVAPGLSMGVGEPKGYHRAKTFIVWGANPVISQPHNMHFIMEAKEQGARYIVIDPAFNANAAKADWYLPINATTDGALALGLLREMMAQGWIDETMARDHTNAPFLIKGDGMFLRMSDLGVEPTEGDPDPATGEPTTIDPFVVWDEASNAPAAYTEAAKPAITGITEVDGIKVRTAYDNLKSIAEEYTLDKTADITGLSADDIAELARVYAQDGPVMTYTCFGWDHYTNAHYNWWPVKLVTILSGNCGSSAAGHGSPGMGFAGGNMAVTQAVSATGEPGLGKGGAYHYNQVENILDNGMFGNIPATLKGLYIAQHGWLSTMSDHDYAQRCLAKCDLVVVTDMFMNETVKWADYALPAAHWFEVEDLYINVGTSPYLIWQDKCIEPLFEARSDFEILKAIATGLGFGEYVDTTVEEYVDGWLDTDAARELGLSAANLKEQKIMRHNAPFEDLVAAADAAGPVFGTATGRAELYADVISKTYDIGQEFFLDKEQNPHWDPSPEISAGCEQRAKFPFHLLTEHLRTHTHSQWWENEYVQEFESGPVLKLNPADAAEYGIEAGDQVKAFNDRGYVVLEAIINAGIPRGTVTTTHAWDASQFIDGHPNSLLYKDYIYAVANQAFNDCAVEIEKL